MKDLILNILSKNKECYTSGESLSKILGVSRAAIWKHIKQLREDGYNIESFSKKGYKLLSCPDILSYEEVSPYIKTNSMAKNYLHFDVLDSTNNKGKELWRELTHGTVIVAEQQNSGKGRLGRSWYCEKSKGILCSIILKPDLETKAVPKVTSLAAAAIYKTLKALDVDVKIKWPNDIILNGKKLCGVLTEMSGDMDSINYLIIGIGININSQANNFPKELTSIATSLALEYNKYFSRKEILGSLLSNFEILWDEFTKGDFSSTLKICKEASAILNKKVILLNRGIEERVTVIDITEEGELKVLDENNNEKLICSGEVSLRGINSYT